MKKILGLITTRTKHFTKYSIKFIKKFIKEIDKFYIITTQEAYDNFFSKIIDFKHKKIIINHDDIFSNKSGSIFFLCAEEIMKENEKNSIIYITGDGGYLVNNPFTYVKNNINLFDDFDILNSIHNHLGRDMCFDTGAFFKNNERSEKFIKKLLDITINSFKYKEMILNANGFKNNNKKLKLKNISRWIITQELFWNIFIKNNSVNELSNLAIVKFSRKFHWAGNSTSPKNFVETLYDSMFFEDRCLINLLGKPKNCLNEILFKYYFEFIDKKDKIMDKDKFVNKFSDYNKSLWNKAILHYKKLFSNKLN